MINSMNCTTAQELLQLLLDQRSTQQIPNEVQEHLAQCQSCANWQVFFASKPVAFSPEWMLPAGFSQRVLDQYSREQRRHKWFRTSSLLALAASVVSAVCIWMFLPSENKTTKFIAQRDLSQQQTFILYQNMMNKFGSIQDQVGRLSALQLQVPETFTQWDFEDVVDPLAITKPAIRTISSTIQGAIEPYEAPARETVKKVKALIDDTDFRKWMNEAKKRMM